MAFEIVDGMTGTKHISSDDLAALNTATVGKASCVLDYGNDFSLTMASANAATLGTGVGMVGGKRFWNQAPVQLTVESGAQGQKRNDLVVARYSKTTEGIESIEPVVIKGRPTTGTAADPAVTANDLKLWRIPINGITVGTPAKLFEIIPALATLNDRVGLFNNATSARFGSNGSDTVQLRVKDSAGNDHAICANKTTGLTVYDYASGKNLFDYRQTKMTVLYTDPNKTGYCSYAKQGLFVVVNVEDISVHARTSKTLGKLPAGFRPKKTVICMAYVRGEDHTGQITVDTDGSVKAYSLFESPTGYFGGTVVFPVL